MAEFLLFYRSGNGSAATATMTANSLHISVEHEPFSLPSNWQIMAASAHHRKVMFYSREHRSAEVGHLEFQDFGSGISGVVYVTDKPFPPGSFSEWSHITWLTQENTLFYDLASGAGALKFDPPKKIFPPGSFSTGWSRIVFGWWTANSFFYNIGNGAAAVKFDPPAKIYPPGSFSPGWTSIAAGPQSDNKDTLLFYNADQRSGALARLDFNGNINTIRSWGPGSFSFWTHVVGTSKGWLFYDHASGKAEVAALNNNGLATTPVQLSPGWTHISRVGKP
ncbi:hypothetical protein [Nonomuraea aridisoli]|uniref:hypothetical protein n=1 Tax=Nonomuraea aridisoli TaxID=2070368 RepID=UPI0011B9439A|nr:hypothetical protein [Nonomuraea aridisoli]